MKASFFKRLAAYLIDIIIVTMISNVITVGFKSEKYENAYNEYFDVINKYSMQEINTQEYLDTMAPVIYDMQEASIVISVISLLTLIAYFVVFQYLNKGQTIGKKILKLRVLENDSEPSLKAIIIRTFIINSIFTTLASVILIYIANRNNYYSMYNVISTIEVIFVFITILFILYRKDKLGLHDIIAKTKVIDERGN